MFRRDAAIYTLIASGSILTIYATAFRLSHELESPDFLRWLVFRGGVPFSPSFAGSLSWIFIGTGRLLVGGKVSPSAYIIGPIAAGLAGYGIVNLFPEKGSILLC